MVTVLWDREEWMGVGRILRTAEPDLRTGIPVDTNDEVCEECEFAQVNFNYAKKCPKLQHLQKGGKHA